MTAVRVSRFGGPEVLEIVDEEPAPVGPGQLGVRIAACGLNWADIDMRRGVYPGAPPPPLTLGIEACGVVEEAGDDTEIAVGTQVALLAPRGLMRDYAVVEESQAVVLGGVEPERVAAFPVSFATAYGALVRGAGVGPGDWIAVTAAGGGLGSAAVQIARLLGAHVIAAASTPEKRQLAARLGAERTCDYDQLATVARDASPAGLAAILDGVGGPLARQCLKLLLPLGRLVVVGASGGEPASFGTADLVAGSRSVVGFHLSSVTADRAAFRMVAARISSWLKAGKLSPVVADRVAMSDVASAHARLESRSVLGKLVIIP